MLGTIAGGDGESGVSKTIVPQGWSYAAIGNLCTLINGKAFKPYEWADAGLPIIRIQNLNNLNAKFNHFSGDVAPKFIVENGELLFAWSGTPDTSFGAHIWTGGRAILNQHIFRILFNETLIDKTFFRIAINQKLRELIGKAHGGVGLRHVTKGKFEHTEILLPPLNEQRRIVAEIEALKARSQRVKEALEAILPLLDQFRQSVLAAAFRGDLTADWREKNPEVEPASVLLERIRAERRRRWEEAELGRMKASGKKLTDDRWKSKYKEPESPDTSELSLIPENWVWGCVEQFADVGTGATPLRSESKYYKGGTIPWVTSGALNALFITNAEEYITPLAVTETNAKVFPKHTLLVALYGEGKTRGKVSELLIDAATNQACAALVIEGLASKIRPIVKLFFQKNYSDLRRLASGGVQPNLNLSMIKATDVPLPPLEEQAEIIKVVGHCMSIADAVEKQYLENLNLINYLEQSILAKAFRGELVPQDSNDEPASVLLERIQAERAKREAEAKADKKSTGKSTGQRSTKAKQHDSESIQLGLPGLE